MAIVYYKKLRDGTWGIAIKSHGAAVRPGDSVVVVTKAGERHTEIIDRVLFEQEGDAICTIKPRRKAGHKRQCLCDEYGCCRPRCNCERHCVCRGGNVFDCLG